MPNYSLSSKASTMEEQKEPLKHRSSFSLLLPKALNMKEHKEPLKHRNTEALFTFEQNPLPDLTFIAKLVSKITTWKIRMTKEKKRNPQNLEAIEGQPKIAKWVSRVSSEKEFDQEVRRCPPRLPFIPRWISKVSFDKGLVHEERDAVVADFKRGSIRQMACKFHKVESKMTV